jgi:hypothetical protein
VDVSDEYIITVTVKMDEEKFDVGKFIEHL